MQVVVLCGGTGTRLRQYTEEIPKALVSIGDKPILWHILKTYSYYGFNDFIFCLGYKGEKIIQYFEHSVQEPWNIKFVDTGQRANTGGRLKKVQQFIEGESFMVTYADGLTDVNLKRLVAFHQQHKKTATLTAIQPVSQFGILNINEKDEIIEFREKPLLNQWVNGGYFVFNQAVFEYIQDNEMLEKEPLERLAEKKEIAAFKHKGFWGCMDTYKDNILLNDAWQENRALWKVWD